MLPNFGKEIHVLVFVFLFFYIIFVLLWWGRFFFILAFESYRVREIEEWRTCMMS
jgi:hypothetical protein